MIRYTRAKQQSIFELCICMSSVCFGLLLSVWDNHDTVLEYTNYKEMYIVFLNKRSLITKIVAIS